MIRRLSLKAVKRGGKLHTTREWIDEYNSKLHSKNHHSIFNGRKVFDSEKGELSLAMVRDELGIERTTLMYYVKSGRLKSYRKGYYYVISRKELDRFKLFEYRASRVELQA